MYCIITQLHNSIQTTVNTFKIIVAKIANRGLQHAKFNYKWPIRGSSLALLKQGT